MFRTTASFYLSCVARNACGALRRRRCRTRHSSQWSPGLRVGNGSRRLRSSPRLLAGLSSPSSLGVMAPQLPKLPPRGMWTPHFIPGRGTNSRSSRMLLPSTTGSAWCSTQSSGRRNGCTASWRQTKRIGGLWSTLTIRTARDSTRRTRTRSTAQAASSSSSTIR